MDRLQKILSQAGIASRRKAEQLITGGHVRVNGKVIKELGTKADPLRDRIEVNGILIRPAKERITVLLNKPDGYITSMHDPEGRPTVRQLLKHLPARLYPVGRLDYHTEGLLIMTNDGDLAQRLQHPSHDIEKIYFAKVRGTPDESQLQRLRKGITLEGRRTRPARIRVLESRHNSWLEVALREGRQNQIRKMFQAVGHPVMKLRRISIGGLRDPKLKPGHYRILGPKEIAKLFSG
jgi:23S rRNA pseudouridine2605 synthase